MDPDLSLSHSLGGLRIANPDDSNPNSPPPTQEGPLRNSSAGLSQVTSANSVDGLQAVAPVPSASSERPLSQLDFDPSSFTTEAINIEKPPLELLPLNNPTEELPKLQQAPPQRSYSSRRPHRQSVPQAFQGQQQAQFPQYPIPPSNHPYTSAARPTSMVQGQSSSHAQLPSRDLSYRLHRETSQTSLHAPPHRTSSRSTHQAMQAGVPMREPSQREGHYRGTNGTQPYTGNGPLPPRRSSRGMGASQVQPVPNGNVSMNGPRARAPSGSPYGLEGGPLQSSEEWQDRGAAIGVRRELDEQGRPVQRFVKKGVKDFNFGRTLGEGSYSTVMLAQDRQSGKEYAIKVLDKRHIIKEKKVKYVNIEKDTLNRLTDHPGVVRLYYTFQDERSLYFVLDVASGGELLGVLKRFGTFDEECSRFYGAQILDTIDYMHSRGVIHRDLKPENVLLDDQMHVKITDFGTAKILDIGNRARKGSNGVPVPGDPIDGLEDNRAVSFVGTAEYVSPELLTEKNACKASDLWAFGCIIYQLLAGRPPFKAANEYLTFQKIVALEYVFPQGFPAVAQDLVERLLVLDPARRLTIEHIKNHEFFQGISWGPVLWKQKAPKLKSYQPPTPGLIKLGSGANGGANNYNTNNGTSKAEAENFPPDIQPSHSTNPVHFSTSPPPPAPAPVRPSPRVITELPPPSQLDIEYSPVLTRNNERILKLGNLLVLTAPAPTSPNKNGNSSNEHRHEGGSSKLSRFFGGGSANKKRQRMVMVTSSGRIIATDSDKKNKLEISILDKSVEWRKCCDAKGITYWCVDTRDKHITFEEPSTGNNSHRNSSTTSFTTNLPTTPSSSNPNLSEPSSSHPSAISAQEWLDALTRGRDMALSQQSYSQQSFSGDDITFREMASASGLPSPANTLDRLTMERTLGASGKGNGASSAGGAGGESTKKHGHGFGHGHESGREGKKGLLMKPSPSFRVASGNGAGGDGAGGDSKDPSSMMGEKEGKENGGGSSRGFKRFSKRQSKSGLAAVF